MIREAKFKDVKDLSSLMNTLGYPSSEEEMSQRMNNILSKNDYMTYVYEEHGECAGMIGMTYSVAYHTDAPHVRVIAFVVEESKQGRGIGRSLMEKAEAWGKSRNAKTIMLNSGNRNERKETHEIYKHYGFHGRATGFYKSL
ncbi:GNAT family N-acetyltransferase [Halobacillus mangrovi]|uniref:GNAT family N-acetyltransferase n=1 Tax=Halobacillus mangrovi TaxID=402384 RepID=UPI003D9786FA